MWILIFISTLVGVFLIITTTDINEALKTIKNGVNKGAQTVDRIVHLRSKSILTKLIDETNAKIQRSNIKLYIPYNTFFHVLLCTGAMLTAFLIASREFNILTSIIFSLIGFISPYVALQLFGDMMNSRLKKYSVDFLIILKNYLKSCGGDIFEAYDKSKDSLIEPLRTYVDILVFEYKHKINPLQALDNLKGKLEINELKLFIENQKICYVHGGDMEELIDEFISDISGLNDDSDKDDAEDKVLNAGLYALLFLNFIFIFLIINSQYKIHIVNTIWGQVTLTLDLLVSLYIVYMTLKKEV